MPERANYPRTVQIKCRSSCQASWCFTGCSLAYNASAVWRTPDYRPPYSFPCDAAFGSLHFIMPKSNM